MAKTLLETLRQKRQAAPQRQQTGGSASLQSLLRARSGKTLGAPRGPRQSNILERTVQQETGEQLRQGQLAQSMQDVGQAQQSAGIEQQRSQQMQQADQRAEDVQNNYLQQSRQLANTLERETLKLDNQKDLAQLEQAGVMYRLGQQEYTMELEDRGRRQRLGNELEFKQELQEAAFNHDLSMFEDRQQFQTVLAAKDNEFRKALKQQKIDFERKIEQAAAKGENLSNIISGLTTVGTSIFSYLDKPSTDDNTDTTDV